MPNSHVKIITYISDTLTDTWGMISKRSSGKVHVKFFVWPSIIISLVLSLLLTLIINIFL